MKKLFIMMLLCAMSICVSAQEHMSFKGVSMGNNLTTFMSQLESKGYTTLLVREKGDGAVLSGSFAGKEDCKVFILVTQKSKLVWKVVVKFPERVSWSSLKSDYSSFKESYTEKYGVPQVYEYFTSPYYEGDGYELQALKLEKCTYASIFKTSLGGILLEITDDKCVQVSYEDAINVEIKSKEKETIISNDI
jgi:hypothetical protein